MQLENIRWDEAEGIVTLTITREKALNALNAATLRDLATAVTALEASTTARAMILTGAGEKAFVAGADIAEMRGLSVEQARQFSVRGHEVMRRMELLPIPTIAAVNGFALGGGCELAMSCDLIYASDKAKFGQPEVNLGVIPGFGGTQRLTRLVGKMRAKELIFTADIIDAAKAKEIGLVLEVLPAAQLTEHCRGVAKKIAQKGPLAVSQGKRVLELGADADLRLANDLESHAFAGLFGSRDLKEGMTAFLEKRPAKFESN